MSAPTLSYFVGIVQRDHPDWPTAAIYWQARQMLKRHPFIEKAYFAYLQIGREVRERLDHDKGFPWLAEMDQLQPSERGFVMDLVRHAVGAKKPPVLESLDSVLKRQKEQVAEERNDDLAADWREKSDRPDKRVVAIEYGKIN